MTWDNWPKNLPTFNGLTPGKSVLRGMEMEAGGMDSIRRVERRDPDGTVHVLYTRAGMPTVITTKAAPPVTYPVTRTFVFCTYGSGTAVVARNLQVVARNLAVEAGGYTVSGTFKTDTETPWYDVHRVDNTALKINGRAPTALTAAAPAYGRGALPHIAAYQMSCEGDAIRSPLFIGVAGTEGPKVVSVSTEGIVRSEVSIPDVAAYSRRGSAGLSVTPDGQFMFIGGALTASAGGAVTVMTCVWAKVRAGLAPPYMQIVASGGKVLEFSSAAPMINKQAVRTTSPFYRSGSGGYTAYYGETYREYIGRVPPESIDTNIYAVFGNFTDLGKPIAASHSSYAASPASTDSTTFTASRTITSYDDLGLKMTAVGEVRGESEYSAFNGKDSWDGPNGMGAATAYSGDYKNGASSMVTTLQMGVESLRTVLDIHVEVDVTITGEHARIITGETVPTIIDYDLSQGGSTILAIPQELMSDPATAVHMAAVSASTATSFSYLTPRPIYSTIDTPYVADMDITLRAVAVDYVFADLTEEIYLTLETKLNFVGVQHGYGGGASTSEKQLEAKYVLSVRGTKYEFPFLDTMQFVAPLVRCAELYVGAETTQYPAFHKAFIPTLVFSPPFMAQGNCPYTAYTTKTEELSGVTPEFYFDMTLLPTTYAAMPGTYDDLYSGVVRFCPHQFLHLFVRYIQGVADSSPAMQNTALWDELFPPAEPFRVQFANGVKGSWSGQLGAGFSGDPYMDISRI